MSDSDSLDFLQTDFDPANLTVPRLRSILVNYDVSYPSTAKKAQLIKIFIDEILPQKSRILRERDHARRSSKGILNAASGESLQTEEDNSNPSRASRRSTRNTSARLKLEEETVEKRSFKREKTSSPVKRPPRASSKHAQASDTENVVDLEVTKKPLRTRQSETPSRNKSESVIAKNSPSDESIKMKKEKRRESAFTHDNPFQSGGSPPLGKNIEARRRTQGVFKEKRKISTFTKRRKTEMAQVEDDVQLPSFTKLEAPVTQCLLKTANGDKDRSQSNFEPGEEFTPEEQFELLHESTKFGDKSVGTSNKRPSSLNSVNFKGPLWAMMLTLLIGYLTWYRQEKIAVGYCGVGRASVPLISTNIRLPKWARILVEPECEPCPYHAYCSDGMKTQCEYDFLLKNHPLSLLGLVPLAPTCEPDGLKARKVKAVADRAVEDLRERRATFECGGCKENAGTVECTAEIDEEDLKQKVADRRRKAMSQAEFDDLFASALVEIKSRDEVHSMTDGTKSKLSSTSHARLPFFCALRRSFSNTLAEYRIQIGGLIIGVFFLLYCRSVIILRRKTNAIIPSLVSLTLQRLVNQAHMHQENNKVERWISIGQLRDDVLRDEHSVEKRESVWRKVRTVIETNANIRSSQKEDRNGEISRVWEWIGAIESRPAH